MATEKQAQRAAVRLRQSLKRRGAFAIDVGRLKRGTGFCVYVYFEKKPLSPLPSETRITDGAKEVQVPVRVVVTDQFKPE